MLYAYWRVWRDDLRLLADFGYQNGVHRCAAKVVSLDAGKAKDDLVERSSEGNILTVEAYIAAS